MKLDITAESDVGLVRRRNEDMILIGQHLFRDGAHLAVVEPVPDVPFFLGIADGLGGHSAGDYASRFVANRFLQGLNGLPAGLNFQELENAIGELTFVSHNELFNDSLRYPEHAGMGSTLVGILFYDDNAYCYNVGDSRAYRLREGILTQLTDDHTLANKLHNRAVPSNILSNCFGGGTVDVHCDFLPVRDGIRNGDTYLLCSDGLYDMAPDQGIRNSLLSDGSAHELVALAKRSGGADNVSVIVAKVTSA